MRADRRAEYKSTNYGVVNPRTLEQVRLLDSITLESVSLTCRR